VAAGTVERFADAGGLFNGLFKVRLDILGATPAARQGGAVFPHPPEHARARRGRRQAAGRALRRYCSGCARETEHVPWPSHGPAHIASIRWPVAEPAGGTTICQDCGQVRVAATRPTAPAWSSWPKTLAEPAARRNGRPTEPVSRRPTREPPRPPGERVDTAEAGVAEPSEGFFMPTRADLRRIEAPPPRAVIWSTR
jgi:hypothetical protein